MKILFIQLPLLSHGGQYISGNVPLAYGAIASYFHHYHPSRFEISSLPEDLSNYGSLPSIADFILKNSFDVISFSTFLWNAEAHLALAQIIKDGKPETAIIFGGPEIDETSWLLSQKRTFADIFVSGEGEWFFSKWPDYSLSEYSHNIHGNTLVIQPQSELIDESVFSKPYIDGFVSPNKDRTLFIEMTRGCVHRCAYCNYSKKASGIRNHPTESIINIFQKAKNESVREIYLIAPSLERYPDLSNLLERLESIRHGISIHGEMRAETVDRTFADKLYRAGFRSLEVGIQTLTEKSRKAIGRSSNIEHELDGMRALRNAGINITIGLIPGLPGDTPADFVNGLNRLCDAGLSDSIHLYPLMVLPGTRMRTIAVNNGAHYQKVPPYLLVEGFDHTHHEINSIFESGRHIIEMDSLRSAPPPEIFHSQGIHLSMNDSDDTLKQNIRSTISEAETHTVLLHLHDFNNANGWNILNEIFPKTNDIHTFFYLVLHSIHILDEEKAFSFLLEHESDSFTRRLALFSPWIEGCRYSLFHFTESSSLFKAAQDMYEIIIPISDKNNI